MSARRKSKAPEGSIWIAQEGMRPRFTNSTRTIYPDATDAFYRVVELMLPLVDERSLSTSAKQDIIHNLPEFGMFYPRGIGAAIRIATPEQRKAINELFIAVSNAIEASHQAGIERGKSLLVQLAKGAVTSKEFNDCAIKGDSE